MRLNRSRHDAYNKVISDIRQEQAHLAKLSTQPEAGNAEVQRFLASQYKINVRRINYLQFQRAIRETLTAA